MPVSSGKGRLLNGSGGDRVKRNNLTEFRGTLWEAVNDWFFGGHNVDYDWRATTDVDLLNVWVLAQAEDNVAELEADTANHQVIVRSDAPDVAAMAGHSNHRTLVTIPETATWGIAHAMTEIVGAHFWNANTLDLPMVRPQHGLGIRAQEDTKRRTIIAWHDVAFGLPQSVNLGVWEGDLAGGNFFNRQNSVALDLDETYPITAATHVNDDTARLEFDGATGNWTTPSTGRKVITDDWSVVMKVALQDWTPTLFANLFARFLTTGNQRSLRCRVNTSGALEVITSATGSSTVKTFTSTANFGSLGAFQDQVIAIDFDADNGASGQTCTFYTAPSVYGPFTQFGSPVTVAGVSAIFGGTANLELGAVNDGTVDRLDGNIKQFTMYNRRFDPDRNVSPGPVVDFRPYLHEGGQTSIVDETGTTWTATGTSTLVNSQIGETTVTVSSHALRVGDRIGLDRVGEEISVTALARASNVVTCTLPGGAETVSGDLIHIVGASDASFNGQHMVNVSGTTATWDDVGSDMSGHTGTLWNKTYWAQTAEVVAVTPTTVTLRNPKPAKATVPTSGASNILREFPYYMEVRSFGSVAQVRCWGRHQALPDWYHRTRAITVVVDAHEEDFAITNRERTGGVATVTIGPHHMIVGERIDITVITGGSTFHVAQEPITAVTATTVSYLNAGTDVTSTASDGNCRRRGCGTVAGVIDHPAPVGSGRIAFVGAHLASLPGAEVKYGGFFGNDSVDSDIIAAAATATSAQIVEHESVIPLAAVTNADAATAVGTGAAFDATVTVAANAPAVDAAATGVANAPTVTVAVNAAAVDASATGVANAPTVTAATNAPAGTAAATGVADNPTVASGSFTSADAGLASATGTADNPTVVAASSAPAGTAVATGVANDPTVVSGSLTDAPAGTAVAAGVANNPTVTVSGDTTANAGHAAATGVAFDATFFVIPVVPDAGWPVTVIDVSNDVLLVDVLQSVTFTDPDGAVLVFDRDQNVAVTDSDNAVSVTDSDQTVVF